MNDAEEDVRNYADRRRLKSACWLLTDIKPRGVYLHYHCSFHYLLIYLFIYLFIYVFIHLLD